MPVIIGLNSNDESHNAAQRTIQNPGRKYCTHGKLTKRPAQMSIL
jgi:hypothetical protein